MYILYDYFAPNTMLSLPKCAIWVSVPRTTGHENNFKEYQFGQFDMGEKYYIIFEHFCGSCKTSSQFFALYCTFVTAGTCQIVTAP